MLVKDIMTAPPITVGTGTTVHSALALLAGHRVTALPVVDRQGRILGVVAEIDLMRGRILPDPRRRGADGPTGATAPNRGRVVDDVMTRRTIVVTPETDVYEVERMASAAGIHSLPVVDPADQVIGMVSRSDVVRVLAREDDELEEDITNSLVRAGLGQCRVDVRDGVAWLDMPTGEPGDLARASRIVTRTPGVTTVHRR